MGTHLCSLVAPCYGKISGYASILYLNESEWTCVILLEALHWAVAREGRVVTGISRREECCTMTCNHPRYPVDSWEQLSCPDNLNQINECMGAETQHSPGCCKSDLSAAGFEVHTGGDSPVTSGV